MFGMEALGVALLVFFACQATSTYRDTDPFMVAISNAVPILLTTMIGFPVSGAHFNPAVTLGLWCTRRVNEYQLALYIGAQLTGSLVAGAFLFLLTYEYTNESVHLITNQLGIPKITVHEGVKIYEVYSVAFIYETLLSFIYVFIFFDIAVVKRYSGLKIGAILGAYILLANACFSPTSGGCINPARAFGPATIQRKLIEGGVWVYYVANMLGGILGALVYDKLMLFNEEQMKELKVSLMTPQKIKKLVEVSIIPGQEQSFEYDNK